MVETSPPSVLEAYFKQFEKDFSLFLQLRSKEILLDGRMVITLLGRRNHNPLSKDGCRIWELLAKSLSDMVEEGLVEEENLASFNLPCYEPSSSELRNIIKAEESFNLDLIETFEINCDVNDDSENEDYVFDNVTSARNVANVVRAVSEYMIVNHFGEEIIDDLFRRHTEHMSEQLAIEKNQARYLGDVHDKEVMKIG